MIVTPSPLTASNCRLKRGTKAADIPFYASTSAPPSLESLDGPFQIAEYLAYKIRHDPHDIDGLVSVPMVASDSTEGDEDKAEKAEKAAFHEQVWIYEHLRRIPIDLTTLLSSLLSQCSKKTCPQMKADEWLYLCTAHGQGGAEECCAIDYILHTVDSTTTLLNSQRTFPSRMLIPRSSIHHFPSICRRLSRIFSHAYFHHREAFQLAESETSLYSRFVKLCEKFRLVGSELLIIPKEAINWRTGGVGEEGDDDDDDFEGRGTGKISSTAITENDTVKSDEQDEEEEDEDEEEEVDDDEDTEDGEGDGSRGRGTNSPGNTNSTSTSQVDKETRRTHSLDRHPPPPPVSLLPRQVASEGPGTSTTSGGGGGGSVRGKSDAAVRPKGLDRGMTITKGTIGRGKSGRGTMLWSSNSTSTSTDHPDAGDSKGKEKEKEKEKEMEGKEGEDISPMNVGGGGGLEATKMTRSDSTDTAIHVPSVDREAEIELREGKDTSEATSTDDSNTGSADDLVESIGEENEVAQVPKDEIELLEEKGELEASSSVSPLPPTLTSSPKAADGPESKGITESNGEMVDVEISEDNHDDGATTTTATTEINNDSESVAEETTSSESAAAAAASAPPPPVSASAKSITGNLPPITQSKEKEDEPSKEISPPRASGKAGKTSSKNPSSPLMSSSSSSSKPSTPAKTLVSNTKSGAKPLLTKSEGDESPSHDTRGKTDGPQGIQGGSPGSISSSSNKQE